MHYKKVVLKHYKKISYQLRVRVRESDSKNNDIK